MAEVPLSYRQVLRLQAVAALLLTTTLSRLGERMYMLVIVLFALDQYHSAALAGWVSFAAITPGLVASPVAGAILDRMGAARGIVFDLSVASVLMAAIAWFGNAGPAPLLALVASCSLTSPLSFAGIRSLIPRLVPISGLGRANAMDSGTYALTDVIGAGLGGTLYGLTGGRTTLLAIAGLLLGAALLLTPIAWRAREAARPHRTRLLHETADGLRFVAMHPVLRGLALSYSLYQASWGVLVVAVPVLVGASLGSGTNRGLAVGLLWAVAGLAGGLGALAAGLLHAAERERPLFMAGLLLTAITIAAMSAGGGFTALALCLGTMGALSGPLDVALLTMRQRCTPADRLGRVIAVSMSLNILGLPIGSVIAGQTMAWSATAALLIAAAACVLSAFAAWRLMPQQPADAAN